MKIIFLIISLLTPAFLDAQEYPSYRFYTIKEFVKEHFVDTQVFYREVYNSIKYPAIARENLLEGTIDVFLINHSDSSYEIKFHNKALPLFTQEIQRVFTKTRDKWLKTEIPFIVNICVDFKLLFDRKKTDLPVSKCKIQVTGFPTTELKDSSYVYDADQINYYPRMVSYPMFHLKKNRKTPVIQTIEDLLEHTIKFCCKKNLRLSHFLGWGQTALPRKMEPKGYIGIAFNEKGIITDIKLHRNLEGEFDSNKLLEKLNEVRFLPALFNGKPVKVALMYKTL